MNKGWESLPPYAKGVIAIAGTLLAAGGIYIAYNAIKTYLANKASNAEVTALTSTLSTLAGKGIYPSLSQQQADSLANELEAAFQGYGTDYATVKRDFQQLANDADMVILLKTFGIRKIGSGAYNPTPDFTGTLSAVMVDELSSSQMDEINTILSQAGITQKF